MYYSNIKDDMRAYVSVDMEGMPGIFHVAQTAPKSFLHEEGRKITTKITKITVEALHENGIDEIYVADSHWYMGSIIYEEMPEYVSLIRGSLRPVDMMYGIERGFDAALFIGYHAAAGTTHAILDHTYSGQSFYEIRVNNVKASEFYINALVAGEYDVPIILVGGDDKLKTDVLEKAPWIEYVTFKESITRYASISPSIYKIEKILRESIKKAVAKIGKEAKPLKVNNPIFTFIMKNTAYADTGERIPNMERIDPYTLRYHAKNIIEAYKVMQILANLVSSLESEIAGLR